MLAKYLVMFLAATAVFSCKKGTVSKNEKYIVSASKMIGLTGINWNDAEPQLKDKVGYQYIAAQPAAVNNVKAEIYLPAIDDSSKVEDGTVYLNVTPNNIASSTNYYTEPLSQSVAYAMMLNYNGESLKILTGITNSNASYTINNIGFNSTVDGILAKLKNGQTADQLSISYKTLPRGTTFTMVLFKQTDGRYVFQYRGNW